MTHERFPLLLQGPETVDVSSISRESRRERVASAQIRSAQKCYLCLRYVVYQCLRKEMATPVGIEPTTSSLEGWRSIQLSYGVTNSF